MKADIPLAWELARALRWKVDNHNGIATLFSTTDPALHAQFIDEAVDIMPLAVTAYFEGEHPVDADTVRKAAEVYVDMLNGDPGWKV